MIAIPYYETSGFVFSNFSPHSVAYRGVTYPTAEHAFHAQKFSDATIVDQINTCGSPLAAWKLAHEHKGERRGDWADVKVQILTDILRCKALQHLEVKNALLATGIEDIVEINPNDGFWGSGADGKGQNQTGKILMQIREELQAEA